MPAQLWSKGHRVPRNLGISSQEESDELAIPASQPQPPNPPVSTVERPPGCINKYPTPAFSLLCTMMDRLRSEEASKRKETLSRFFELWRVKVGNDLYPLVRLLLPDRDRERPVYNLKEAMLAKCYIEVLGLDKHSEAAQRLIKWKQPVDGQTDGNSGDFARVCYHEIAARSTVEEGRLSIEAVNTLLDQLAGGRLKQHEYVPILRKINQQCTPVEQEWIIRIILKDLRISIREKGVFACLHPDAGDLFNVCSDLKRVCWTLYSPEIRLEKHQAHIDLFRSFLPQLCYRSPTSSHEAIAKLVGAPEKPFIMEEKLDGERMQLHMRGSGAQWFYCSRKAKDYTYLYGAHIGEGSLTQYIANAFHEDVRNIILDGEMLVWDPILEKYVAFGTLKTAASDRGGDENAPRPCFKVFDILYLNDVCLTNKRLSERKRLLRSDRIFRNIESHRGRLEFAEEQLGKTGKDIRSMLERVLESKGEGLVVKRLDAVYQTNSRGADWVKVKPEYSDQMGENLDLLVLGGWWGKGGRTGKISSLLCGLRNQQHDDGSGESSKFTTFCKIGSGMSYEDYEWILNKHKQHWIPFDRQNPPDWLTLGASGTEDKPDVVIRPENSFVVEVKASEIVPAAGTFGINYTMRFPRCRYIYWDKASRDHPSGGDDHQDRDMWNSLSVDEFLELLNQPKRKYTDEEGGSSRRKKRKTTTRKKVELISNARGQRLSEEQVESHIFEGITFYVIKGDSQNDKAKLEALVHAHGGSYTQAQLSDLSAYVISPDDKNVLVKAQKKKGISVVKPEWIYESIKRRVKLPLIQEFFVYASAEDRDGRYFQKSLDEIDKISFVRDRGGSFEIGNPAAEKNDDTEDSYQSEEVEEANEKAAKTQVQLDLESEWDLTPRLVAQPGRPRAQDEVVAAGRPLDLAGFDSDEDDDRASADSHDSEPEQIEDADLLMRRYDPSTSMGQHGHAMEYDDEKIFTHLVFYIDSAANAVKNGLEVSHPTTEIIERLERAEKLLRDHGGRIVTDVQDPTITHIIMDDFDSGRYAHLSRRTAKPRRKHIVLPSWVDECLEEETLMNEDGHKPR